MWPKPRGRSRRTSIWSEPVEPNHGVDPGIAATRIRIVHGGSLHQEEIDGRRRDFIGLQDQRMLPRDEQILGSREMWIVMKKTPSAVPSMRDDLRTAILTQLRSGSDLFLNLARCRESIRVPSMYPARSLSRGWTKVESSAPIFLQRQIVSRMVVFPPCFPAPP